MPSYRSPFHYNWIDKAIDEGRKVISDVRETAKDAELNRRLTARKASNLLLLVEATQRPIRRSAS